MISKEGHIKYNHDVQGLSGVKCRFDLVVNDDNSPYLVLDILLNPSSNGVLSFYAKCLDVKPKNAVFITSKLSREDKNLLKDCCSKTFIVELEE